MNPFVRFVRSTFHASRFTVLAFRLRHNPSRAFLIFMILSLNGCLLGPDYQQPEIEVPGDWESMTLNEESRAVQIAYDHLPEATWWETFENEELNNLVARALEKNHDVREAGFRVLEGRALTTAAGAGLYPQLNVNGSYSRNRRSETILVSPTSGAPQGFAPPGANFDIWNALLDLRWELDLWGRIRRGMEAAEAGAVALEMERQGILLSLISDVGQAYFRLRELDEQIEIADKNLALRKDSLNLLTTRADAGLISDLDVKRAEILVAESAAQIPDLQRQRAIQLHQLEVLTGSNPNTLALPAQSLRKVIHQPVIPIGMPSQLLERRPDIRRVEQDLISANARIGEARAFFFPSLAITGNGGFQSQ